MNAFEFFNRNFGQRLNREPPGNRPHMDAWRALSMQHPMQDKKPTRLMSGWAIVRPSGTVMQQRLAVDGIDYDERRRADAFGEELDAWDGGPRIFLVFDKSPVPIANLFMTLDLRAVLARLQQTDLEPVFVRRELDAGETSLRIQPVRLLTERIRVTEGAGR